MPEEDQTKQTIDPDAFERELTTDLDGSLDTWSSAWLARYHSRNNLAK